MSERHCHGPSTPQPARKERAGEKSRLASVGMTQFRRIESRAHRSDGLRDI